MHGSDKVSIHICTCSNNTLRRGYQIVDFMTLSVGIVVLGCSQVGDTVKMLNFIKILYSTPGFLSIGKTA